jgi:hypothetical protein
MTKLLNDATQDSNIEQKSPNIDLIYSYTEALIKSQEDSINRLDTRLGAFLAFSGVILKFAIDLPSHLSLESAGNLACNTCFLLKIAICGFTIAAIIVSTLGLTAKQRGRVVDPERLMDDKWYFANNERCKAFIINTWIETKKEYILVGNTKGKRLNLTIRLICFAAIAFGLNIVLLSIYR